MAGAVAPGSRREGALIVMIAGASGLRNADWSFMGSDVSDPYCVCEVEGQPHLTFETPVLNNTLNPIWNHVEKIEGFAAGASLKFHVWDKDEGKTDDFLGCVTLEAKDYEGAGFSGSLSLSEAGKGIHARLYLMVVQSPLCQGYLTKLGQTEAVRYFVLKEDALFYFNSKEDYLAREEQNPAFCVPEAGHCHRMVSVERGVAGARTSAGAAFCGLSLAARRGCPGTCLRCSAKLPRGMLCYGCQACGRAFCKKCRPEARPRCAASSAGGYSHVVEPHQVQRQDWKGMPLDIIEEVAVSEQCLMKIYLHGSPKASNKAVQLRPSSYLDGQRWGMAIEKGLMLNGVSELSQLMRVPLCEGNIELKWEDDSGGPKTMFCVLYGDMAALFESCDAYLRHAQADETVPLRNLSKVRTADVGLLRLLMHRGRSLRFMPRSAFDAERWGEAWRKAVRMHAAETRGVNWERFAAVPILAGPLQITSGGRTTLRHFVLLVDRLVYYKSEEDHRCGREQRGWIALSGIARVVVENSQLRVCMNDGMTCRFVETRPGDAERWAGSIEVALTMRGSGAVVVHDPDRSLQHTDF